MITQMNDRSESYLKIYSKELSWKVIVVLLLYARWSPCRWWV